MLSGCVHKNEIQFSLGAGCKECDQHAVALASISGDKWSDNAMDMHTRTSKDLVMWCQKRH